MVEPLYDKQRAVQLDREDPLRHLRNEFLYPTKADLKSRKLVNVDTDVSSDEDKPCLYLCGNSLGLQPKRTMRRLEDHMSSWAKKGVLGHFERHEDSFLESFADLDTQAATMLAPLVGASPQEVAVAETLTANLHLLISTFYKPTKERHKIIIEKKAFPSDHYAVVSQIVRHGFDPKSALVLIPPESSTKRTMDLLQIEAVIDEHADTAALILLPGIQYYTGQYLDIEHITAHADSLGITIGWDLAHAVGNVELFLHEWNVDFAVWCHYKYVNAGPGAIAGLFVHEKHGHVDQFGSGSGQQALQPRLAGWWGAEKSTRFDMAPNFVPTPGAQGFQLGNPSALAISALIASLEVFQLTSMEALCKKSVGLTGYMEELLLNSPNSKKLIDEGLLQIITPSGSTERGAQLSIQVHSKLLEEILKLLKAEGIVVDERKPDVIRVAPAPLYNTYLEVCAFVQMFTMACYAAAEQAGFKLDHPYSLKPWIGPTTV